MTCMSIINIFALFDVTAFPTNSTSDIVYNDEKEAVAQNTFFTQKSSCSVKEVNSGSVKPCQFPFIFKGETFKCCTDKIGKDANTGEWKTGKPWCSTNTDWDNKHIEGNRYYGDCNGECKLH